MSLSREMRMHDAVQSGECERAIRLVDARMTAMKPLVRDDWRQHLDRALGCIEATTAEWNANPNANEMQVGRYEERLRAARLSRDVALKVLTGQPIERLAEGLSQ